ncbi:hypothetical protein HYT52_04710 [Candidatus Woesearchaeota archaeon]|nr:hypothetical protein [Candidatus Woesearchaeota archaeon]
MPENSHNFSEEKLKSADFVWADEVTFKWISKEKIELSHKLKKPFYAISPDLIPESVFSESIEQRWKELLNSGVDKICTGKVKEFLDFIGSKKN